jgi:hypothetical protein
MTTPAGNFGGDRLDHGAESSVGSGYMAGSERSSGVLDGERGSAPRGRHRREPAEYDSRSGLYGAGREDSAKLGGHEQEGSWDSQYDPLFRDRRDSGEYPPADQSKRIEELARDAGVSTAPKEGEIDDKKMQAFMAAREARREEFKKVPGQLLAKAQGAAQERERRAAVEEKIRARRERTENQEDLERGR